MVLDQSILWVFVGHSIHPTTSPSLPCLQPSFEPVGFVSSSSPDILTRFRGSWWVLPSMKHGLAASQFS